jgi:hypothetical protein
LTRIGNAIASLSSGTERERVRGNQTPSGATTKIMRNKTQAERMKVTELAVTTSRHCGHSTRSAGTQNVFVLVVYASFSHAWLPLHVCLFVFLVLFPPSGRYKQ